MPRTPVAPATPPDAPTQGEPARPVVWVVDADPTYAEQARHHLAREHDVELFADGPALLARLRPGAAPDVILLAALLPGRGGLEVLGDLRAAWDPLRLPVLMVTSQARRQDVVAGFRAGANDYLIKPYDPFEMLARVDALVRVRRLGERRLRAEVERATSRTARLQAATAAFSEARTPEQVADVAMRHGGAAFDAPRGLLAVLEAGGDHLEVVRALGYSPDEVARWRRLPLELRAPFTDAARIGSPAFYESPAEVAAAYPSLAAGRVDGDQALGVIPLVASGAVLGVMGLVFTAPRAFDESDRAYMATFARLCAQALERARLYAAQAQARGAAEAMSRSKDEWIAMVSHELRSPLNAMLGWTRMLRSGQLPPEKRERALETIERNAVNQTQLIEDLLDVSRMVSGQLRLGLQPVALGALARSALDAVRPAAEARGVRLEAAIDDEVGDVTGDPDRLLQVINNLLGNAVKFVDAGGAIGLDVRRVEGGVELAVRDDGRGIDPAFAPYLFDRFKQQEGGIDRGHGGLGLGLSIVRHVVELHGGAVRAHSAGVGRG
ncbi:MAG: rpfC2, partial [Myxococcaceae bacterium]|nr:rpfC2 [Myxococcaceae bacterium]